MRVLHVISTMAAGYGGPVRAVQIMQKTLLLQGVRAEIATTDDDGRGRRCTPSVGAAPADSARVELTSIHRFRKQTDFYKVAPTFLPWIAREVRKYDVVHIHGLFNFVSVAAAWAARRAEIPYVIRPYGTLNRYGITQRRPWLKRISIQFVEGPLLRSAACVHFTAQAELDEAKDLGLQIRPVVIPLGVDAPEFASGAAAKHHFPELEQCRVVLFLSRVSPKKNLECLLRAFALLAAEFRDLRLLIAGSGDRRYVETLEALSSELQISSAITWAGFVEGERKAAAMAAADVFVLPSHSENFGIAAAEALLAGVPCVLAKGVALANSVASVGAGCAVEATPADIAAALRPLLTDNTMRTAMSLRARAYARDAFSVEAMGKRLVDLYRSVLRTN